MGEVLHRQAGWLQLNNSNYFGQEEVRQGEGTHLLCLTAEGDEVSILTLDPSIPIL